VEFKLLELNNDLLALGAEHHAAQLLNEQLKMFNLFAA
jgi:hypothetical protein